MKIDYLSHKTTALYSSYLRDISKIQSHIEEPIYVIFDVGANTGGTTLALRSKFKNASIFAFEPFNGNFNKLRDVTESDSNTYIYNIGFSNENRKNVPIGMPVIPKTKTHNYGRTTTQFDGEPIGTIELVKMSDWIQTPPMPLHFRSDRQISTPDLLWMDIEGCEIHVIRDLMEADLLKRIPYMYIEINPAYPESLKIPELLNPMFEQIYISGKRHLKNGMVNYLFKRKQL